MPDLYEALGVGPDATEAEIKAAHRRAVKKTHPDAGGERQAFDRVQKAFNVLSDQSRRARYDETGVENEVDPEQLMRAQAMTTVAGKMNELLCDPKVDPRHFDLVLGIRELLSTERHNLLSQISDSRSMQRRLAEFEKRLKRKKDKDGTDRVRPMITAQREAHGSRIAVLEDGLKVIAMATELVEEYVYATDPAQQAVYVQDLLGRGGAGGPRSSW